MTEDTAELSRRISDADAPSRTAPERLRLQWNVPEGVTPYVPLWLTLLFLGLIVVAIVAAVV